MTRDKQEPIVPDSELDFDEDLTYRWRGELFTGVGYENILGRGRSDGPSNSSSAECAPRGRRVRESQVSYRYGTQEGPARDWYPSGTLKGESFFRENVQHGARREYDQGGVLIRESFYEYGILVSEKERNARGEMIAKSILSPGDKNHELLERYRREKGWPLTL